MAEVPNAKEVVKRSNWDAAQARYSALKPFVIISLSYLLYTTTDGAIRMIVLLHAYNTGFSAWECAIMFTAYETAGVFTNLAAGMMGARWGIKTTLLTGLSLQLAGIAILYGWSESWAEPGQKWKAILFVTMAQMLCGIAKDLTKLGGKTVTKLVSKDEKQTYLFKLVSLITGWKNSLKGVGYFIGAACITFNYYFALGVLLFLILLAMPWAVTGLSNQLGRARSKNLGLFEIFKQKYNVNVLSVSRYFLFGARDMWFEVPLPYFLRNSVQGLGWPRPLTGLFLAVWIIVYGQVQSWTPQLALQPLRQSPANKYVAVFWNMLLVTSPIMMGAVVQWAPAFEQRDLGSMQAAIIVCLAWFCIVFAVNSSIHSYLIVKYADGDKVALNIGFYYCANAMGRLTGTLVSGALYSFVDPNDVRPGFAACFWASSGFALISALIECLVKDNAGGLQLGPCLTLVKPPAADQLSPKDHGHEGNSETKVESQDLGAVGGHVSIVMNLAATDGTGVKGLPVVMERQGLGDTLDGNFNEAKLVEMSGINQGTYSSAAATSVNSHPEDAPLSHIISHLLSPDLDLARHAPRLHGRRVLLRLDLNVPVASATSAVSAGTQTHESNVKNLPQQTGLVVTDMSRIEAALPGVRLMMEAGAKVILASHFGRPEPKKQSLQEMTSHYSLAPVAQVLAGLLGSSFKGLADDCVGDKAAAAVAALQPGQVLLLENTRFHSGDVSNDPGFAAALASLADVYVCDAFGVMHRDQASVTGVTHHIRECYPGPLVVKELQYLGQYLDTPKRPLGILIGGAKVADKIGIIGTLIQKADVVAIGGRMAFTFLAALGVRVGRTQVEDAWVQPAREMIQAAQDRGVRLLLPCDVLVSHSLSHPDRLHEQQLTTTCCSEEAPCIPADCYGVDIGPATAQLFAEALGQCSTVFWNGPMGKFEVPAFAAGTHIMAKALAALQARGGVTICGGGDSVAAVSALGLTHSFTHISTGGGASLELLEGLGMPGLRALAAAARKHQTQQ